MTKIGIVALWLGASLLILASLPLQLLAPGDSAHQDGPGSVQIAFSADHAMVIAPGACVTVRWQADGIHTAAINGVQTLNQSSQQVCVDSAVMPVLHVEFNDNTTADYHLNVRFLVDQPSTWLSGVLVLLLGLVSLWVILRRPASSATTPAPRTLRRGAPRIVWVLASIGAVTSIVVVGVVAAELALRFFFVHFGSQGAQDAYLSSREEIATRLSDTVALPFVEFGLSPDYPGHNALGYRGDPIQVPKPEGVYRIIALGDSTTYGSLAAYDQTYPYDLQQTLRADYGRSNVEVINGGVPFYTSWNILADLTFRVAELQPNLVIIYEGWNDLEPREVAPDCYSNPSPFLGLDPRRQLRAEAGDLSPFALYRFMAIKFGWMKNPALAESSTVASPLKCGAQIEAQIPQNLSANPPTYFERNVRDMIAIANANGFQIMFMTWAYDPNNAHMLDYQRAAIAQNNAITAQVAQGRPDALFFDYAAVASTDKASWTDSAHPTIQGNLEQAQLIAKYLVDQGVITQHRP